MKIACLLAPRLPVQVERQHTPTLAETPLVVGGRPWDPGAVLDCCALAVAAGVTPGMRLSQAEALCPTARFVPAREELYRTAHDALAAAASHFTPAVETAGTGLLFAEVSGLERRCGPDLQLAHYMAQEAGQVLRLGSGQAPAAGSGQDCEWDVRVGMGSGKFVAWQAARAAQPGSGCAVPPGEERAFLSSLPLSALSADPEMERRLHLLGVRTLGALAALPRLAVVRQFGPHAGPLYDLARGVDPRPVHPTAPPLALERTRTFNDPLDERAALLAHADQMAAELAALLSRRGYQAEGLRLRLEDEDGQEHSAGVRVAPPSADGGHLSRLAARLLGRACPEAPRDGATSVREYAEGLAPGGPVVSLSLIVYPMRPFHLGATQLALFTGTMDRRGERLRETLRGLRERFGDMIVVVASLLGPPPPRPIHVTTDPEGLPRALVWRDRIHQVETIYETWRERRCWWSHPVERDYFRLETDKGQVRVVFRDVRSGRWLLERRHV